MISRLLVPTLKHGPLVEVPEFSFPTKGISVLLIGLLPLLEDEKLVVVEDNLQG
jgi:hypothetical protein